MNTLLATSASSSSSSPSAPTIASHFLSDKYTLSSNSKNNNQSNNNNNNPLQSISNSSSSSSSNISLPQSMLPSLSPPAPATASGTASSSSSSFSSFKNNRQSLISSSNTLLQINTNDEGMNVGSGHIFRSDRNLSVSPSALLLSNKSSSERGTLSTPNQRLTADALRSDIKKDDGILYPHPITSSSASSSSSTTPSGAAASRRTSSLPSLEQYGLLAMRNDNGIVGAGVGFKLNNDELLDTEENGLSGGAHDTLNNSRGLDNLSSSGIVDSILNKGEESKNTIEKKKLTLPPHLQLTQLTQSNERKRNKNSPATRSADSLHQTGFDVNIANDELIDDHLSKMWRENDQSSLAIQSHARKLLSRNDTVPIYYDEIIASNHSDVSSDSSKNATTATAATSASSSLGGRTQRQRTPGVINNPNQFPGDIERSSDATPDKILPWNIRFRTSPAALSSEKVKSDSVNKGKVLNSNSSINSNQVSNKMQNINSSEKYSRESGKKQSSASSSSSSSSSSSTSSSTSSNVPDKNTESQTAEATTKQRQTSASVASAPHSYSRESNLSSSESHVSNNSSPALLSSSKGNKKNKKGSNDDSSTGLANEINELREQLGRLAVMNKYLEVQKRDISKLKDDEHDLVEKLTKENSDLKSEKQKLEAKLQETIQKNEMLSQTIANLPANNGNNIASPIQANQVDPASIIHRRIASVGASSSLIARRGGKHRESHRSSEIQAITTMVDEDIIAMSKQERKELEILESQTGKMDDTLNAQAAKAAMRQLLITTTMLRDVQTVSRANNEALNTAKDLIRKQRDALTESRKRIVELERLLAQRNSSPYTVGTSPIKSGESSDKGSSLSYVSQGEALPSSDNSASKPSVTSPTMTPAVVHVLSPLPPPSSSKFPRDSSSIGSNRVVSDELQ